MSTLDATVSMLEVMPEEARVLVFRYTQALFTSRKPANPFVLVTETGGFKYIPEANCRR